MKNIIAMIILCIAVLGALGYVLIRFLRFLHKVEVKRWGIKEANPDEKIGFLKKLLNKGDK